jgi:calcineurin-like phosphoesterase family protein
VADIWVLSDWHWRHENIYKFTYQLDGVERRVRERFASAAEGDAYIEQAIRETVKDGDTLLFLGDMTLFRGNQCAADFIKLMVSLPGRHWLILGNHDHYPAKHYVEAGFKKVRASMQFDQVLFSHFPLHESSLGRVKVNAHGHIHQNKSPEGPYRNCCVEVTDYRPVAFESIRDGV